MSAFGQPSETKPIFGAALAVRGGSSAASVMRAIFADRPALLRRWRESLRRDPVQGPLGYRLVGVPRPIGAGKMVSACLFSCSCICMKTLRDCSR